MKGDIEMVSSKRVRISLSPTVEILEKVDSLAQKMGMTRSATCSFLISTALESYDCLSNLPEDKLKILVDTLDN